MQWREILAPDGAVLSLGIVEPSAPRITLVCVHGWTLDHRSFRKQIPLCDLGVRLVVFDRRGFGENAAAPGLDLEMDDLNAVIEQFDGPVIGFGVSQGARSLMRHSVCYPDRLAGLVVQGGLVDGLPTDAEEIPVARFSALIQAGDLQTFFCEWLAHPLMGAGVPPSQQEEVADLVSGYKGRDLMPDAIQAEPMDITAALQSASVPLAVIEASEENEVRRRHAVFLAQQCGATAIPMPGGHLCHFTHADVFNARLMKWLTRLGH